MLHPQPAMLHPQPAMLPFAQAHYLGINTLSARDYVSVYLEVDL